MPELPDLLYIRSHLEGVLKARCVVSCEVRRTVVVRNTLDRPFREAVAGVRFTGVRVRGPFLVLASAGKAEIVLHLMLAGTLHHITPGARLPGHLAVALELDDSCRLCLCDEQAMAKLYLVPPGRYATIPRFLGQGIDILAAQFTPDAFLKLLRHNTRKQVRSFLTDQTALSAIGNAYADEILFHARIHPKTFVARLSEADGVRLHASIGTVMEEGIRTVRDAGQPIHVKVRGHMRVRNRKGEACPRCGTKIRREGVRGYDVFFCPACQPPTRDLFLDWSRVRRPEG